MNVKTLIKATFIILALSVFVVDTADAQRQRRGASEPAKEVLYPNATRTEPKIKPSPRMQRDVQKMLKTNEEGDFQAVISEGQKIIDAKASGAYERALAYQLIGYAKVQLDDFSGAISAFQSAYAADGLDNNGHYNMLLQVANLQYQEDQFEQANATVDQLLAETRKEDGQMLALKGGILYQLERYNEAAEVMKRAIATSDEPQENWTQLLMGAYINGENFSEAIALGERLLAENPDDARLLYNVATMYAQSDNYDKATAVLETARTRDMLDERGFRQLYALYLNMEGKEAEAIMVINDGLEKKHLSPSAEIYNALGQAYYFSDQVPNAIEAYRKALPYAKDGESALNLARLLSNEERYTDSKKYAQEALEKGLRRPGDAHIIIGRAEYGMGNRAGLVAAYREAAKYPETKQTAEEWLKKNASR